MVINNWFETTIGEQATLQRGIDITRAEQRPGRVPVVSSGGISSYHDTAQIKAPGVVLGRKGVVGSVYYITEDYWPHDTTLWVKDFHGNHPRFVYYFFKSIASQIARMDVGSANPTLNRNHVHPIKVLWPPLDEQKAIAHILSSLDDKIELNQQMNRTLEGIARALFKSWFIDFDPVRAKLDGRQPAGMDAETAALFPAEFEDSASGIVPKNWTYISLSDMTDRNTPITYGVVKPGPIDDNGVLFIRGGDIENGQIKIEQLRTITKDVSEQYKRTVLRGDEILISLVGNPGQLAVVPDSLKGCNIARQVGLIRINDNYGVQYIKYFLGSPAGQIELFARSLGSVQQVINLKELKTLKVINPGNKLIKRFEDIVSPLYKKEQTNLEQNRTLRAIRDALLPKLLSGEIRVKEAEKIVAEVA